MLQFLLSAKVLPGSTQINTKSEIAVMTIFNFSDFSNSSSCSKAEMVSNLYQLKGYLDLAFLHLWHLFQKQLELTCHEKFSISTLQPQRDPSVF